MKIYIPYRRVEAPDLTEEQIGKLIDGRYVEGEFGLEEGDMFPIRFGNRTFRIVCYRVVDTRKRRLRALVNPIARCSDSDWIIFYRSYSRGFH